MNSWNHELIHRLYRKQISGFITNVDGHIRLQPPVVANQYRKLAAESIPLSDKEILGKAVQNAKADMAEAAPPPFPYTKPCFGYVTQWLSELGQTELLNGLLDYADKELNPTWENGGLYYPRNDTPFEFSANEAVEGVKWTHVSPFCGNAAIAYARLNVKDGQRIMYEKPWTREHLAATPWIDGLEFASKEHGVSVLRGVWDGSAQALIVTVKGWDFPGASESVTVKPTAKSLHAGTWAAYVGGKLFNTLEVKGGTVEAFSVEQSVKRGEEVDFVFMKVDGVVNGLANGHAH
jgi:hypothetical protein